MMTLNLPQKTSLSYLLKTFLIIGLCGLFLFYKYVLQVYPGVASDDLIQAFKLSKENLGFLAAAFYYTYLFTQLSAGIILDRYSPRYFTALAISFGASGALLFATAQDLLGAEVARALMGAGAAFATIAYMKLSANWVTPKYYSFVGGFLLTAAMLGAVFGQAVLAHFIQKYGWRQSLSYLGFGGFLLAAVFVLIVRDQPDLKQANTWKTECNHLTSIQALCSVIKNPQNWLLALYCGFVFSPVAIFGGL